MELGKINLPKCVYQYTIPEVTVIICCMISFSSSSEREDQCWSFISNSLRLLLKVRGEIPSSSAILVQEKCNSLRNSICLLDTWNFGWPFIPVYILSHSLNERSTILSLNSSARFSKNSVSLVNEANNSFMLSKMCSISRSLLNYE